MELPLKSQIFEKLSDEDFFQFCVEQKNIRVERNADKTINLISPSYPEYSAIILKIAIQLSRWNELHKKVRFLNPLLVFSCLMDL